MRCVAPVASPATVRSLDEETVVVAALTVMREESAPRPRPKKPGPCPRPSRPRPLSAVNVVVPPTVRFSWIEFVVPVSYAACAAPAVVL